MDSSDIVEERGSSRLGTCRRLRRSNVRTCVATVQYVSILFICMYQITYLAEYRVATISQARHERSAR